jgi:hypothetical protein
MVSVDVEPVVVRDYSRASQVLIAIQLRLLEEDREESDEPDPGLRPSVN